MLKQIYSTKNNTLLTISTLLLVFVVISQLPKLKLLTEYSVYFDEDNQAYNTFVSVEEKYTKNDNIFIAVQAPENKDMFNQRGLELLFNLTDKSWQTPHVSRVDSITNFIRTQAIGDDLEVEELVTDLALLDEKKMVDIKGYVLSEQLLLNQLISENGTISAVNLTMNLPGINQNKETSDAVNKVKEILNELRRDYPEYRFYVSGLVMLNNTFFEVSSSDLVKLIPAMMLIILMVASILLRSWLSFFALTFTVILSALASLGAAAILGINLTSPSISAPIILLTISVASGVHVIVALKREINKFSEKDTILLNAIKKCGVPVTLTNFTTIIGFASMNLSDSPPFRDLGNIVALGVAFSWILSMTFIPWTMVRFVKNKKEYQKIRSDYFSKLAEFITIYSAPISYIGLPGVFIISVLALNNTPNDNFVEYFDKSVPFRAQTEIIDKQLTGIHTFEFSIETEVENGVMQPKVLLFADKFANWLRSQEEVANVYTLTDIIKEINKNMHGGDQDFHKIPASIEETMQYFLVYEMSIPYGRNIDDRINIDKSSIRTTARFYNIDTQEVLLFEEKINKFLSENTIEGVNVVNSSLTTLFTHVGLLTINSLVQGAIIALLVVSLILMFVFHSIKIGLLSIFPNIIPIGMAFGIWSIINGEVSMGLATVCTMTIGIVVDDTIHFLHHYFDFRRQGLSVNEANKKVLQTVGPAMLVSSVVLSIGFFILAMSYFEKNALMGLLTAITIILALLADMIFMPAVIVQWEKLRKKKIAPLQVQVGS